MAYHEQVKFDVLGVPVGPVVTEAAAAAMAEGVRRVTGSDVGLGITGVAGPDDQEGVAPGTIFVGLALPDRHRGPGVPPARATGSGCASTGPFPPSTCCGGPSSPWGLTLRLGRRLRLERRRPTAEAQPGHTGGKIADGNL